MICANDRSRGAGPSRTAEDHAECGRILFRQKKYAEALAAFDEALKAYPGDYGPAHRLRAEALVQLDRFAEAIPEMDAYLKTAGKPVADVFRARGLAHAKMREYDRAVEDYTQALDIDQRENRPRNPETLAYRGWAYVLCDAPRLARAVRGGAQDNARNADALRRAAMPASGWETKEAGGRRGRPSAKVLERCVQRGRVYSLAAGAPS